MISPLVVNDSRQGFFAGDQAGEKTEDTEITKQMEPAQ